MAKYVTLSALQTFYSGLKTKLNGKVSVEEGKGLSEINVTQTMVDGWNAAEKNVIVGINVKKGEGDSSPVSATIDPESRVATIVFPSKLSEFTNDMTEGETALLTKAFYTSTIAPAIANATDGKLVMAIVDVLPAADDLDAKTIYLVPKEISGDEAAEQGADNVYDEYIVVVEDGVKRAEKIGDTKLDLSGYVKAEDVVAVTDQEIQAMIAAVDAE